MTSPAQTVALIQNKGGVGKTTVTLSLAAVAASSGLNVLVVDADQQENATLLLDPEHTNSGGDFTIYDIVADGGVGVAQHAAVGTAWNTLPGLTRKGGRVDLLAADTQMNDSHVANFPLTNLANALFLTDTYDLILIDCPPSTGLVVQAVLAAADQAVIVTQAQHLSVRGIQQSQTLIEEFNAAAAGNWQPVTLAGIIINQYVAQQVEHKDSLLEIEQAFPELTWMPPIPHRAVVQRAMGAHYPLTEIGDVSSKEITSISQKFLDTLRSMHTASVSLPAAMEA